MIDHKDLDTVATESLIEAGVGAIVNAASCISGRYPNLGPEIIVQAGIPLIDDLGGAVMSVREGRPLRVEDAAVYSGGVLIAEGVEQTLDEFELVLRLGEVGLECLTEFLAVGVLGHLGQGLDELGLGAGDVLEFVDEQFVQAGQVFGHG